MTNQWWIPLRGSNVIPKGFRGKFVYFRGELLVLGRVYPCRCPFSPSNKTGCQKFGCCNLHNPLAPRSWRASNGRLRKGRGAGSWSSPAWAKTPHRQKTLVLFKGIVIITFGGEMFLFFLSTVWDVLCLFKPTFSSSLLVIFLYNAVRLLSSPIREPRRLVRLPTRKKLERSGGVCWRGRNRNLISKKNDDTLKTETVP